MLYWTHIRGKLNFFCYLLTDLPSLFYHIAKRPLWEKFWHIIYMNNKYNEEFSVWKIFYWIFRSSLHCMIEFDSYHEIEISLVCRDLFCDPLVSSYIYATWKYAFSDMRFCLIPVESLELRTRDISCLVSTYTCITGHYDSKFSAHHH